MRIELCDPFDEIRAVREIEIVDAVRDRGAHERVRVAVGLERPAGIDDDVGFQGGELCVGIAVTVEDARQQRRAHLVRGAELLRLLERAARDDQRQALFIGEKLRQPAAERTVTAEDQNGEPLIHHARNLSAWRGSGR